ncbi:phosphatase inhibitor-domain-containing protein [Trametes polyzona]|nr:phosphatase inhibitor-domain-containing protein [Trametes polyzona]
MATRQLRPSEGSRTITVQDNQPREEDSHSEAESAVGTLRLRGAPRNRPRVVWREDVVDNEGAGKKKSKICCIYHKPRQFDESSSDESSDSDSDSSCDSRAPRRCRGHDHDHDDHTDGSSHGTATRDGQGGGVVHELESDSDDVNAYERAPRKKPKKNKGVPHKHS